jgi:hypothetical protein
MLLNENYIRVCIDINLTHFILGMVWQHKDSLSQLLFIFSLEYAAKGIEANLEGLQLNGVHQLLIYINDVNIAGESIPTKRKAQKLH